MDKETTEELLSSTKLIKRITYFDNKLWTPLQLNKQGTPKHGPENEKIDETIHRLTTDRWYGYKIF